MPLFNYECKKCGEESEILVRGAEQPVCPVCGSKRLVKQSSAFAPMAGSSKPSVPCECADASCASSCPGMCPHL